MVLIISIITITITIFIAIIFVIGITLIIIIALKPRQKCIVDFLRVVISPLLRISTKDRKQNAGAYELTSKWKAQKNQRVEGRKSSVILSGLFRCTPVAKAENCRCADLEAFKGCPESVSNQRRKSPKRIQN